MIESAVLVTIIPNERGVKVKVKIGPSHNTDKNLIFQVFLLDQLKTWRESSTWAATQLISFEGRSLMTCMVSARIENGVSLGQILKSKEL
jgi:hypothetical protein